MRTLLSRIVRIPLMKNGGQRRPLLYLGRPMGFDGRIARKRLRPAAGAKPEPI